MDPVAILVGNFADALAQANRYLALGLVASISALVLELRPHSERATSSVTVPGGFVAMEPETAKLLLLGVAFVAGALGYLATERAVEIAGRLQANPDVFHAVCTYSSIATAPIGYRIIGAALPLGFGLPIFFRIWSRLRALSPEESRGILAGVGFFSTPYLALGLVMVRLPCPA